MSFEERLIDEVRSHDILYNLSSADYKNVLAKANVWRSISRRLGVPEDHAKKRWKNLRDVYRRNKHRLELQSGSDTRAYKKKWQFFKKMRFLDSVAFASNTMDNLHPELKVQIAESPPFEVVLFPENSKSTRSSPSTFSRLSPVSSPACSSVSSPACSSVSSPASSHVPEPFSPKRSSHEGVPEQFCQLLDTASQPLIERCTRTSSTRQLCEALATRIENAGLTNDETGMVELAVAECVINKIKEIKDMRAYNS